jgi:hypothetical protein
MTASVDFSKTNKRHLQFVFSRKPVIKKSVPVQKEPELVLAPLLDEIPEKSLEVKKLTAIYTALKKSGRYNVRDLERIEKRLKDLK